MIFSFNVEVERNAKLERKWEKRKITFSWCWHWTLQWLCEKGKNWWSRIKFIASMGEGNATISTCDTAHWRPFGYFYSFSIYTYVRKGFYFVYISIICIYKRKYILNIIPVKFSSYNIFWTGFHLHIEKQATIQYYFSI